MLLVVPGGDILPRTIVVHGSTALRTVGLRDALANRASQSWSVQPGEDQTGRGVTFPPRGLGGQTRGSALPELLGVLTVRGLEEGDRRH